MRSAIRFGIVLALATFAFSHAYAQRDGEQEAGHGELVGHVATENGADVENLLVKARRSDSSDVFITETNRDGSFHLENMPTGTYTVEIRRAGSVVARKRVQLTGRVEERFDL